MAWARAFLKASRQDFTGAAQTWLVVNMPATVAGTSETIRARSRFLPFSEPLPVPSRLMSQKTPEARKPLGATMEPGILFISKERGGEVEVNEQRRDIGQGEGDRTGGAFRIA